MVWLNAAEANGNALYFDIYRTERHSGSDSHRYSFAGDLGDGSYEGEVQIEVGPGGVSITFADAWLNPQALQEFFRRSDRAAIETALDEICRCLAETAEDELATLPRRHRPAPAHRRRPAEDESTLVFA